MKRIARLSLFTFLLCLPIFSISLLSCRKKKKNDAPVLLDLLRIRVVELSATSNALDSLTKLTIDSSILISGSPGAARTESQLNASAGGNFQFFSIPLRAAANTQITVTTTADTSQLGIGITTAENAQSIAAIKDSAQKANKITALSKDTHTR